MVHPDVTAGGPFTIVDNPMSLISWRFPDLAPRSRPRRRTGLFVLEHLEQRQLLSTMLPSGIDAIQPAGGSALLQSPQQWTITFNPSDVNQFNGFFPLAGIVATDVASNGNNAEFVIDRVGAGGTTVPVMGGTTSQGLQVNVLTQIDADGNITQAQLVLTPATGDQPLPPGTYQIDLLPWTNLDGVFGFLYPDDPAWNASAPTPIGEFTILGAGSTFGDAINVGNLGAGPLRTVDGFIDPANSQTEVALYQVTLPPGHLWQLNTQVFAGRIDSPLPAGLALFDSRGNVLAVQKGVALNGGWVDPNLTQGLAGGTYYVAVSAAGDLPGAPGGYNLLTGTAGTAAFGAPGGAFRLELSAVPVAGTTTLIGSQLEHADAMTTAPTGLLLTFSGPIDLASLFAPDRQETALQVIDSSGKAWPITARDYQSTTHTLSFIFDAPLPAGNYRLVAPEDGGLTDLAGQAIVAPEGAAPGVLASWTVAAPGPAAPGNLGVLWPGPVNVTWDSSVSGSTLLPAGQETTYRFVVICPGLYQIQTQVRGGPLGLSVTGGGSNGSNGATEFSASGLERLNQSNIMLQPGVYFMNMAASGPGPALVNWTLSPLALDYEKIVLNGVGQAPALTLTLVTGPAVAVPELPASSDLSDDEGPGATAGAGLAAIAASSSAAPIPPGLLPLSLDSGLLGAPGSGMAPSGPLGPGAEGALVTMAIGQPGQGPAPRAASDPDEVVAPVDRSPLINAPALAVRPPAGPDQPIAPTLKADIARSDEMVLERAGALMKALAWAQDWFVAPGDGGPPADTALARADDGGAIGDREEIVPSARAHTQAQGRPADLASVDNPISKSVLLLAAAIAIRLREPVQGWWRRARRPALQATPQRRPFARRGPHARPHPENARRRARKRRASA